MKLFLTLFLFVWLCMGRQAANAQVALQDAFPALTFDQPVALANAGDRSGRLFVVSKNGVIHIFSNNSSVTTAHPFLDIRSNDVERELLGLAFSPYFKNDGSFYVFYTQETSFPEAILSRFKVSTGDPNQADLQSEEVLLRYTLPEAGFVGGKIAFGPDGYLYITTGDIRSNKRNPVSYAQDLRSLLGKVLRIDINSSSSYLPYGIPQDNPFRNNKQGILKEIYAYGFRHPGTISFEPVSGMLWVTDAGKTGKEEVNLVTRGGNYGWPIKEGNSCIQHSQFCDDQRLISPVRELSSSGSYPLVGGVIYKGSHLPFLHGKLLYADAAVNGSIRSFYQDVNGARISALVLHSREQISAMGEDQEGEIYICSKSDGKVYQVTMAKLDALYEKRQPISSVQIAATPNPASQQVNIDFYLPTPATVDLSVSNFLGTWEDTLIRKQFLGEGKQRVSYNIKDLQPGEYKYLLKTDKEVHSGRIRISK